MNFEQFQATRTWVDDVREATGFDLEDTMPGFVYAEDLHIFAMGSARELYRLDIFDAVKVSDDLAQLERDLYEHALGENILMVSEP